MSDEFDDLYGSKYLCVADLKGTKPRLKIGKVTLPSFGRRTAM